MQNIIPLFLFLCVINIRSMYTFFGTHHIPDKEIYYTAAIWKAGNETGEFKDAFWGKKCEDER
jgi:hypothetical protein